MANLLLEIYKCSRASAFLRDDTVTIYNCLYLCSCLRSRHGLTGSGFAFPQGYAGTVAIILNGTTTIGVLVD